NLVVTQSARQLDRSLTPLDRRRVMGGEHGELRHGAECHGELIARAERLQSCNGLGRVAMRFLPPTEKPVQPRQRTLRVPGALRIAVGAPDCECVPARINGALELTRKEAFI